MTWATVPRSDRYGYPKTDRTSVQHTLKLIALLKSVFKKDGNLDFNIGKTKIPVKGPTVPHTYSITQNISSTMIPTFRKLTMISHSICLLLTPMILSLEYVTVEVYE